MRKHLEKKGHGLRNRYATELNQRIMMFVKDCVGKSDGEIRELYKWYEKNWHSFANTMNSKLKGNQDFLVLGFTDAFESAMGKFYLELPRLKKDSSVTRADYEHYKRVFNMFREKNWLQRFFHSMFSKN